jgi:hypothetical protein
MTEILLEDDDEEIKRALQAYLDAGKNQRKAAEALGMSRESLQRRLKIAARKGWMLDDPAAWPGFMITEEKKQTRRGKVVSQSITQKPEVHGEDFEMLPTHRLGMVTYQVKSGKVERFWPRAMPGAVDPLQVAERLKNVFTGWEPAALPKPAPLFTSSSLLTFLPVNDWHLNMHAWGRQVGQSWDLKIAERVLGQGVSNTLARTTPSDLCIICGGGDLLHTNGKKNETANGTPQDTDGRFQKGVDVAGRLMVLTIDTALDHHKRVIVRILKGNHDEDSSVAIAYFLLAWYRNEPRVIVDVDPSDYFWHRFGLVMIGATHGHQSSNHIAKMPGIMATRRAADWGATKFRYVHGFHLHHSAKYATEENGVISEVHQAPVPQDAWHFGSGFLSGRSMQAITYHKDFGEIGRVREAILDAKEAA